MSSPQPSQLPTSQEIEAVILAATNNLTITGQPLKDTRTQVFVGNLPYRVRWQDLKDLFRSPPPTPSSEFHHPQIQESRVTNTVLRADVSLGPDNRSRGYGTVLLATKEDADRCINLLDGYCWMGRVLEVRVDRLVASPSAAMFPGGVSGVGVGTTPPPPPLQQQQQQMQGMGKTLYLTNIPPQTQWTSLKDLLRALQITVIRVDLSLSSSSSSSLPSSSSTSWAKVIVASSNDVRRAIGGLDGIEYMGYVLRVRTEEELVQLQTSLLQQEEAAMVPIPPSQSQSPIPEGGRGGRRSVPPPLPLPLGSLAPGSGSPPREKEKDRDTSSNASSSNSAETTRSTSSRHHLPPHLRHHTHHQPHPHPQHPGPISLPLSVLTHPHPHPHHPYSPLHHPSQTQLGLPPLTPSMPSFQFSGTTSGTPLQPHFLSPGIGIGGGNGTPGGGNGGNGWGRTPGGWGMMMLGGMGSPPIMQQQSPMHHPQPGDYFQPPMIPSPYQQPPPQQQQQQPEYFPPVPPVPPPPPNSLLTSPDPSLTSFDPSSSISGSSPSSVSGLTTDDGSGGSPGISQNTSSIATSLSSSASSSFSSPGEEGSQGKATMTRTTSDPLTSTSSSEVSAPGLPSPPSSPRHPPPPLKKKDHPRFKESEFANIISGGAFAALNLGGGVGGTTPLGQRRNSWTPGTERGPVF